jgi:transcriptional regulator with XRE-family HTH domain
MTLVSLTNGMAEAVGATIRQARIGLDQTKADCARAAGLSRRTWHELEEGQRLTTTVETLTQIEDVLGLEPGALYRMTGEPQYAEAEALRARAWEILQRWSVDDLQHWIETEGVESFRASVRADIDELRRQIADVQRDAQAVAAPAAEASHTRRHRAGAQ